MRVAFDLHWFEARDGMPRASVTAEHGERSKPVELTAEESAMCLRVMRRALHRLRQPENGVITARPTCADATGCTAATDGSGAVGCNDAGGST